MSKALEAAVKAYDEARCKAHGPSEKPMSDANRQTIAPMIQASINAFLDAAAGDREAVERGREIIANGCGCDRNCEDAHSDGYCGCRQESKAAILALKEAVNG